LVKTRQDCARGTNTVRSGGTAQQVGAGTAGTAGPFGGQELACTVGDRGEKGSLGGVGYLSLPRRVVAETSMRSGCAAGHPGACCPAENSYFIKALSSGLHYSWYTRAVLRTRHGSLLSLGASICIRIPRRGAGIGCARERAGARSAGLDWQARELASERRESAIE
jgi:hypothetical protein